MFCVGFSMCVFVLNQVLGLEMTASCENGKKWTRPPTPNLISSHSHHVSVQ